MRNRTNTDQNKIVADCRRKIMSKEMLINTVEGHECRIVVVENGVLEELYVERASSASRVGNIYKARVMNVEPAIQAAFVDFGDGKNGFLHISDINPQYFPRGQKGAESVGHKRSHRDRPPIQECMRRGQEVIVQMTKEGLGTKGPTLTTYLSIPGRLLVMMPGMSRMGVSRKIQDEQARSQARQILEDLVLPPDMGFIVRTAGIDRPKRELQRDLNFLTRLWKSVSQQIKTAKAPSEIYQESDLVIRTIRDVYNTDIDRIICDSKAVSGKVKDFLDLAMPRTKHIIELYTGQAGLFHEFGLEDEIERMYNRRVELKSGGWLALDQAEALVAIDVNSGRFREHSDAETTATKINVEAAGEIARQLRLRDLGGVVIIDFIDMRDEKNRRQVEKAFRDAIKKDRSKTKVLKISPFGIVEMTRQRVRPSLRDSIYRRCSDCDGMGLIKSEESQALSVMRRLQRVICLPDIAQIDLAVTARVAHYLANFHRGEIVEMESRSGMRILITADPVMHSDQMRIICTNNRGSEVNWDAQQPAAVKKPPQTVSISQFAGTEESAETAEELAESIAENVSENISDIASQDDSDDDVEGGNPQDAASSARPGQQHNAQAGQAVLAADHYAQPPASQPSQARPIASPGRGQAQQNQRQAQSGQAGQLPAQPVQAQQLSAGQPGQPGQPGLPGQGRRRRRGRRGGQRHKKLLQAQPGLQADTPNKPAQPGQPVPQSQPTQSQSQIPKAQSAQQTLPGMSRAGTESATPARQVSDVPQAQPIKPASQEPQHQPAPASQPTPLGPQAQMESAQVTPPVESKPAARRPRSRRRPRQQPASTQPGDQASGEAATPQPTKVDQPAQRPVSPPAQRQPVPVVHEDIATPQPASPDQPAPVEGAEPGLDVKRPRRRGRRGGRRHHKKTTTDGVAGTDASQGIADEPTAAPHEQPE
jgi:ribonuclease E